jgi:hypothetical protein
LAIDRYDLKTIRNLSGGALCALQIRSVKVAGGIASGVRIKTARDQRYKFQYEYCYEYFTD